MGTTVDWGTSANAEAIEAWDGVLFDRFLAYRHIFTTGLGAHGDRAIDLTAPAPGERVIDIGCGFGDTTQVLAERVGPDGEAFGVDASPRFIEMACREAEEAAVANARFAAADVQTAELPGGFDLAFSRMGTMFFANPVAAMRNVRGALRPGGRLMMVVWRRKEDNAWTLRAQEIVERFLTRPEEHEEPTCGPGPFSMAGADTTSDILQAAGFTDVSLRRCDLPMTVGRDLDEALGVVTMLGPAAEIIRLSGEAAVPLMPQIEAALREAMAEWVTPDGDVVAPASTWLVSAVAPEG